MYKNRDIAFVCSNRTKNERHIPSGSRGAHCLVVVVVVVVAVAPTHWPLHALRANARTHHLKALGGACGQCRLMASARDRDRLNPKPGLIIY